MQDSSCMLLLFAGGARDAAARPAM